MARDVIELIGNLRYQEIPVAVRALMRRSLLDTFGVAAVGSSTEIAAITRRFSQSQMPAAADGPVARILFSGLQASPVGAAMASAYCIDAIDAHDGNSHVKGHAGSGVIPALLAVVDGLQQAGHAVSGEALMVALVIGYEVGYRSGLCMHGTVSDYHTSGAWTAVGAAAGAARLLQLNSDQTQHALGIAEYHGPRSQMMRCIDHPSMLRDGVGWGAPAGLSAAFMAQLGFTGAPAITAQSTEAASYWTDVGERWEIENTHYKAYPVCRWAHPAMDAVRALMGEHGLSSGDIERAQIHTFHNAIRLAGHAPQSMDELAYSLAFPFAIMAVHGELGLAQMQAGILDDPEVKRLSAATELVESDHYTAISVGKRWAEVRLFLRDGRELRSETCTPRGDPDNPLSDAEITQKFHAFAGSVLGPKSAAQIEALTVKFDCLGSEELGELIALVTSAPAP